MSNAPSLKGMLPQAGMAYPAGDTIMGLEHEDIMAIDEKIADAFTIGLQPLLASAVGGPESGIVDMASKMHSSVPWARELTHETFSNFCGALRVARVAWYVSPRPPLDDEDHSLTAKAIHIFYTIIGGLWGEDSELERLVDGWDTDELGADDNDREEEGGQTLAAPLTHAGPSGDIEQFAVSLFSPSIQSILQIEGDVDVMAVDGEDSGVLLRGGLCWTPPHGVPKSDNISLIP
ncbi:hypothetical protein GGS23DRAFT_593998 [Durotheca rogersii]|uniref:uncharacterized protein n=1 Tax=Durotheca rogersii TaxID=419775 RepID=UPI00222089B7|nr:uncharacterized protein GGS23DRAFT_593998 [Durotheca rogersii]KAI5865826.1 hypothetical protein GGS23DRAFT_593998 [Durotheca rogersii]